MTPIAQPRFPTNKVIAFLGPYLAIASGVLAAWLGRNFPGLELNVNDTALAITQASEFAIGAVITWALHHKYLHGWQQWEQGVLSLQAAAAAAAREAAGGPLAEPADAPPPSWSPGAFGAAAGSAPQNGGG